MQFRDEQIGRFEDLYQKRYKKGVSKQDVLEQAIMLINYLKVLYRPISQKEYDDLLRQEARRCFRHLKFQAFVRCKKG